MGARRILLVDDDPDFTDSTSAILEGAGYAVTVARDGEEGLELARAQHPDLIVLDVMMSSLLEGLNVGEELRADPTFADTPVLMLSAIATTEHLDKFPTDQPLPAQYFLTKPVPAAQLLETVKRMIAESAPRTTAG